jgi:competence/damage-inducible protein cinA C-terminal domain
MDIAQITRYKTIKLYGLNPEAVEAVIQKKINELEGVNYVIELHDGRIHIVLSASANSEEEAKETIKPMYTFLKKELGEFIYSTRKEDTLEAIVVKLLEKYELTVSTTESCTGGLLAARFINVAGVSEVYKEGFITYTNKSKRKRLNVDKQTLKKYGAVSKQTAKEMVMGLVMQTDSDCGLAVTGIAGPDGGTIEKPVGLVYIACFVKNTTVVKKYNFDGDRMQVREQAVSAALNLLRKTILEVL